MSAPAVSLRPSQQPCSVSSLRRWIWLGFFCLWMPLLLGAQSADSRWIEVSTDSLHLVFDRQGAVPVTWEVTDPRYVDQARDERVALIDAAHAREPGALRPLDLITADVSLNRLLHASSYTATRRDTPDAIELEFTLPPAGSGVQLRRTYRIPKRGFTLNLTLAWRARDNPARLVLGPGLGFDPVARGGLSDGMYAYVAPVWAASGKITTSKLSADHPRETGPAAPLWAGIHSRYFLFAVAPGSGTSFTAVETSLPDGDSAVPQASRPVKPVLEVTLGNQSSASGSEATESVTVFGGPKIRTELAAGGAGFDRVLFSRVWSWIRWLCLALLEVLLWLHHLVPSWGLSLILLAAIIRLVTFPVAQFGMREQARFNAAHARLRPELDRIKLACKGDPQRQHEETTALYRRHGVSPFAAFKGCGWVLLQIPIFIALFNLIGQEYALRGASFLWIDDLSQPDRLFPLGVTLPFFGSYFNILPVLMAATQVFVSNISSPAGADAVQTKNQRRSMVLMALGFGVLFYTFPSGLIIYWTAANLGHLVQQKLVARA